MFLADAVDLTTDLAAAKPVQDGRDLLFRPANRHAKIQARIRPGRLADWKVIAAEFAGVPEALRAARPYDFSGLDVMNVGDGVDPAGSALFDEGVIRLPSEVCWFEYDAWNAPGMSAGLRFGLLVEAIPLGIKVRHFIAATGGAGLRQMQISTYGIEMLRDSLIDDETRWKAGGDLGSKHGTVTVVNDPLFHLQESADAYPNPNAMPMRERIGHLVMPQTFALYLMLALASNVKTVAPVAAKKFANQRRRSKGLHPVPDHWLVTLPTDWSPGYRNEPATWYGTGTSARDFV